MQRNNNIFICSFKKTSKFALVWIKNVPTVLPRYNQHMSGRTLTISQVFKGSNTFMFCRVRWLFIVAFCIEFSTIVKYEPPDALSKNSLEECDVEFTDGDVIDIPTSGTG